MTHTGALMARRFWTACGWLCLLTALLGCQQTQPAAAAQRAATIEQGDECHLCGMIIAQLPGPKAQLYEQGSPRAHKFCSIRDLLAYALDPEHQHRIQSVFVHDMAITPWDHPDDQTYIDARQAWYVIGSNKRGAMGPGLASFGDEAHARAFMASQGGRLYRYAQIDQAVLAQIGH